jgi:hypothetical protein
MEPASPPTAVDEAGRDAAQVIDGQLCALVYIPETVRKLSAPTGSNGLILDDRSAVRACQQSPTSP